MKIFPILIFLFLTLSLTAQKVVQPDAAEILQEIQKLKVLGSVLYVAAHPDDENTRLIAWLANEKLVKTGYLSMTRGDGGQNLIGPEIREKLGIIRTQELLSARRIDKGEQFFTRANDFGYSKSPEETFNLWNEEKILSDVVWVIRKFRPDVVVTRFPENGEGGHGHHTASAILANKAFELAGDVNAFPEQLKFVKPWQPKRLFLNTGRWWNPNMNGDEPGVVTVDVGAYNPLIGQSYSEMAALSRSQHRSQGFGSTGTRGEALEFLEHKKGEPAEESIFDGIDLSWQRIGAPEIEDKINKIIEDYNPVKPENSVQPLLELRKSIKKIDNVNWREQKLKDIDRIVRAALGLYFEAVASNTYLVPTGEVDLTVELTNRSSIPITVNAIHWPHDVHSDSSFVLRSNEAQKISGSFKLNRQTPYSTPYWLINEPEPGYYNVNDRELIGKGENDPALEVGIHLSVLGSNFIYKVPVVYKWNDAVMGEQHRPVAIVPPVSLSFGEDIYLFPDQQAKNVSVKVKSFTNSFDGRIKLNLPSDWKSSPEYAEITFTERSAEQEINFTVYPPKGQSMVRADIEAVVDGKILSKKVVEISYEHFPVQTMVINAQAEFVKLDVKINGNMIGYVEGAGDAIPSTLKELGYSVITLSEQRMKEDLSNFDAIIVGVRALNTNERIRYMMEDLLNYVEQDGVLLFQYNTSFRLHTEDFSPFPLTLGRDRVTVEESPVTILHPNHPVMNYPNKISLQDFQGWVQERGLYFPARWDDKFIPVLAMNDPGEPETRGSLLIAPYGKGYYVYSGISWFRQLPAGVPGAIRLFANILSLKDQSDDAK